MTSHQTAIITSLHVAFKTLRTATASQCPEGTHVSLVGNGQYINIEISQEGLVLVTYGIKYTTDGDLVENLLVGRCDALGSLCGLAYAMQFIEMAREFVQSTSDYKAE